MAARLARPSSLVMDAQPRRKAIPMGEDNRSRRGLAKPALRCAGYARYVVILLDRARPDTSGLTGLDELKRGRRTRSIRVLRVSASASLMPDQHACHAGAVVQKFFRVAHLLAQPERALGPAG